MRRLALLLLVFHLSLSTISAQNDAAGRIKSRLADYFQNYRNDAFTSADVIRLTNVEVDAQQRTVSLYTNAGFASQPFTPETVQQIHDEVGRLMPEPYKTYQTLIYANGSLIEELMPLAENDTVFQRRRWGGVEYGGYPWVSPVSQPYAIMRGLQGRHLSVWASHGSYYDFPQNAWRWQRPRLYCTCEDLFTQSFVVPFLIPMLENAGACVFTPRERDWQREEVIVDNDIDNRHGVYTETNGTYEWGEAGVGFCDMQDFYFDKENPFLLGTCRKAEAQSRRRQASQILWQPSLPQEGRYAVYVSYASLPTSVSDAEYTVRHRGIATKFHVNQKMGGGTWVYLGTFDFGKGCSNDNCVTLSNVSNYRGVITADAVRFGGGMGNIARGDSVNASVRSGMPRFLEGSRYTAQWGGMPYSVYGTKDGTNDYGEDINSRSLMTNLLARGSDYLPGDSGLSVPIELSLAVHSDAGLRTDTSYIGTLGIYTSGSHTQGDFEGLLAEGLLPGGMSRLTSRDLCDKVMTQVVADIRALCGNWNRRQMYDRNYSETRLPQVPSMILETLSHQNFADLLRGHDPTFKMLLSRAIYKGILKYIATVHNTPSLVTQPLPVHAFSAVLDARGDSVLLSWQPTEDTLDSTASTVFYVVYTSAGERGYDNGKVVYESCVKLPVKKGMLTRYQVRAVNEGGASLPSEELCVYSAPQERKRVLVVNAFDRLAGPQPIETDSTRGFDMDIDPGVVYQHSPCYCGKQVNFSKSCFRGSRENALGYSSDELEGVIIAGNTFDFPTQHTRAFLLGHPDLSISSCSKEALLQGVSLRGYQALDLICGAQRADGYSMNASSALTQNLCDILSDFTRQGGSLLVSGAYWGGEADADFAANVLHLRAEGQAELTDSTNTMEGMNTQFSIYSEPNEEKYAVRRIDIINPLPDAFCSVVSVNPLPSTSEADSLSLNISPEEVTQSLPSPSDVAPMSLRSFSVAYSGTDYRTIAFSLPLECIREADVRNAVLSASLTYLFQR
ncbi:MAG: hypothetical protein J6Y39_00425 [Bacteroidaceae bacterium]|nr:hypothetical protein [Bacteroidaceae bacterium]